MGLTQFQLDKLMLGFIIRQERQQEQVESERNREQGRPNSRAATRRKAQRLKEQRGYQ